MPLGGSEISKLRLVWVVPCIRRRSELLTTAGRELQAVRRSRETLVSGSYTQKSTDKKPCPFSAI